MFPACGGTIHWVPNTHRKGSVLDCSVRDTRKGKGSSKEIDYHDKKIGKKELN